MIFQNSALSYSYGVAVESIWIADPIDATLAFDDDHFRWNRILVQSE